MKEKKVLIGALALMFLLSISMVSATHWRPCWGWSCWEPPVVVPEPPVVEPEPEPVVVVEPVIVHPKGKPWGYNDICVSDKETGTALFVMIKNEVVLNVGKYIQDGEYLSNPEYEGKTCSDIFPVKVAAPVKPKWRI